MYESVYQCDVCMLQTDGGDTNTPETGSGGTDSQHAGSGRPHAHHAPRPGQDQVTHTSLSRITKWLICISWPNVVTDCIMEPLFERFWFEIVWLCNHLSDEAISDNILCLARGSAIWDWVGRRIHIWSTTNVYRSTNIHMLIWGLLHFKK